MRSHEKIQRKDLRHTAFDRVFENDQRRQRSIHLAIQSALFELLIQDCADETFQSELCEIARTKLDCNLVLLLKGSAAGEWLPCSIAQSEVNTQLDSVCGFVLENAPLASKSPVPVVLQFVSPGDSSATLPVVIQPIRTGPMVSQIMAFCFDSQEAIRLAMPHIVSFTDAFQHRKAGAPKCIDDWKLRSLASMMEMISEVEVSRSLTEASNRITDLLKNYLGCDAVSLSLLPPITSGKRHAKLFSISGQSVTKTSSKIRESFDQVVREALIRSCGDVKSEDTATKNATTGCWSDSQEVSIAHQELKKEFGCRFVTSHLLRTIRGDRVGVLVLAGNLPSEAQDRLQRYMNAFSPRLGTTIRAIQNASTPFYAKWHSGEPSTVASRMRWLAFPVTCGLLAAAMSTSIQYRIRSACAVEPAERRFVGAPFSGRIETSFVKPGDRVEKGDVLARMDGQDLRLKVASVHSEKQKASRARETELNRNEIAAALQSEFEIERLNAELTMLNHQLESLDIRSPIAGIILSGDVQLLSNRSISTGHVLHEVAPEDSYKVLVDVAAEDRANASAGMSCSVWIAGHEEQVLHGVLSSFRPVSEIRGGKNVFVAEMAISESSIKLQPGMSGLARIDGNPCSLGWALFHKPWGFLKSRLTFW